MPFSKLSPAMRVRLARLVLIITIGTTIATSDAHWRVQDDDSLELPSTIPADGIVTQGVVHYQSPRGIWPLWLYAEVSSEPWSAFTVEKELSFDSAEVSATSDQPDHFNVRCEDKLCEGMIAVALHIKRNSSAVGTLREGADGGLTPALLTLSAGVLGGPESLFGCQRQQSSTDRSEPPSKLLVDVKLDPLEEALYGDAGAPLPAAARGDTALSTLRGLDAGQE